MAAVCLQCTIGDDVVEFPNMLALKAHEMTGHQTRPDKVLPVDPRGDHPSATELKAGKVPVKKPDTLPPPPVDPEQPPKPLKLQYAWTGQCPTCRDSVKTIEIEMGGHNVIVAYCVRCDKKLLQQQVIPITSQGVKMQMGKTFEEGVRGRK
jgi:hypothetical protein